MEIRRKGGKDEEDERVSEKSGKEAVGIRVSNGGQCQICVLQF
jgi:hypothetical protein